MDIDGDALSNLVHSQAQKAGISGKEAKKALKKLKTGKINMAQVAPHLTQAFSQLNANMSPAERMRAKLKEKKTSRLSRLTKEHEYEKTRQRVLENKEKEEQKKISEQQEAARRRRNHNKRIKELDRKLGTVSQELYNVCLKNLHENKYKDESDRNRNRNIIEVYGRQQQFKEKLEMDDMEEFLSD